MVETGVIRKIDDLGRICIPKEIRKHLNINDFDAIEFTVDGDKIVLKKFSETCVFCGSQDNLIPFKGNKICSNCKCDLTK